MVKDFTALYRKIIEPIIVKHAPEAKIILYGSRARGDFKSGSDIDIALDMGHVIDTRVINNILGDLEESELPIFFDVVDFRKVSEDMQKRILKDGIVWK